MAVARMGIEGLDKAKQLCENRDLRAKQLQREGKKVIGYYCCYPPLEFLTALDLVPHRIMGSVREPIIQADAYLETIACPYIRNCLDKGLRKDFDFLDGLVVPHSCDNVQRIFDIWNYYLKPQYSHFINVPHMLQPSSFDFFKAELVTFKKSLENYAGKQISEQSLCRAIQLHNQIRALVRELYDLRRQEPPLVSGSEVIQTMVAAMVIPSAELIQLLRAVTDEVKDRPKQSPDDRARVLVYGCEMDSPEFIQLVEECGANVVMDDLCIGSRFFQGDVEDTEDPIDGLATRYLEKVLCPRSYRPRTGSHEQDLANRFGYLSDYVNQFNVNGAILYIIRFCDTHEFDAPDVRDYLQSIGLPVLHIEDDYTLASIEGLRTRVQAFVEMIG